MKSKNAIKEIKVINAILHKFQNEITKKFHDHILGIALVPSRSSSEAKF
jgi:hypothetical protein